MGDCQRGLGTAAAVWGVLHAQNALFGQAQITVDLTIEALNQHTADSSTDVPPDPTLGVGGEVVALGVNHTIKLYNDDGTPIGGEQRSLNQLFGLSGAMPFDPRVVFDAHSSRFVIITIGGGPLRCGWSESAGQAGFPDLANWKHVQAQSGSLEPVCDQQNLKGGLDQPSLGYDDSVWLVSTELTNILPPLGPPQTKSVNVFYVFAKNDPNQNVTPLFSSAFPDDECLESTEDFPRGTESARPAQHIESPEHVVNGQTVNTPYFAAVIRKNTGAPCPSSAPHNTLRLYSIADPNGAGQSLHLHDVAAPECFDAKEGHYVRVFDNRDRLLAGDARLHWAVYRRFQDDEFLYVAHTVQVNAMMPGPEDNGIPPIQVEQLRVRWYQIDINGWPGDNSGEPFITDWGEVNGGTELLDEISVPVHLFQPSIGVNDDGDIAIVMQKASQASLLQFAAWGRTAGGGEAPLKVIATSNSNVTPTAGLNRFGDYTDIAFDPDGEAFWGAGQVMIDNVADPENLTPMNPNDDGWGTMFVKFHVN